MVNSEEFIKKLETILDYYSLNASAFADKIGVQRSSLSHLLSGRNKPSLDFIMKIVEHFPEVDLYWFLMNLGSFPKSENVVPTPQNLFDAVTEKITDESVGKKSESSSSDATLPSEKKVGLEKSFQKTDEEKVIVFYKDGTFESYRPK